MYNNVVPFKTKKFPNEGIWRVHAFGEVRRNPNIFSEALVDLFIVPLIDENCPEKELNKSRSYDYSRLQSVQIGIGQITGICVGSLLRDQKRTYRLPEYETATVSFNSTNDFAGIIRAGDDYSDKWHHSHPTKIFPTNHYEISDGLWGMPCITYRVEKEFTENGRIVTKPDLIIIPCWVVFQYYFATSSRLASSLINGDLEKGSNLIFNPASPLTYHNYEDGYFYLRLRQTMIDKDVRTIARIAADERIIQDVANIYNSMVANFNNGKGAFPEAYLPFFGETRMKLHGKNIKNEQEWFFFVYSIESCSGEYYYKKLKFDRDNDGTKPLIENPIAEETWNIPKMPKSKPGEKEGERNITDDEPPSLTIIETEVVLPPRKFLSQPTDVRKIIKKNSDYRSAQAEIVRLNSGTERDLSTGSGESGGESGELNIQTDPERKERKPRESDPPNFNSMLEVLETIRRENLSDFDYGLLPVIENDEYETSGFSVFPSRSDGKRIAWSFVPGNPIRRRQVLVAEIIFKEKYFYLFEIERRIDDLGKPKESFNTFVFHKNLVRTEKSNFEKILLHLANVKGVCKDEWEFSTVTREKFKHTWKIEDFSLTLLNFFVSEIVKEKKVRDSPKDCRKEFREVNRISDENGNVTDIRLVG